MKDRDDLVEALHGRSLLIASNRGPIAFERGPGGELVPKRGAGGLVTALSQVMRLVSGTWVATAMTSGDRELIRRQQDERIEVKLNDELFQLRYLTFDREVFDRYYNRISNWILWFLLHGLWNLPLQPRFDRHTRESWRSYEAVNERFAKALAEEISRAEQSPPAMLHDYHLILTAGYLRRQIPDAFIYHFIHCPWPQPDTMRILPSDLARQTLAGMLANDLLGFQTSRWARNFMRCCEEFLGAELDPPNGIIRYEDTETTVRHYPISIDVDAVQQLAGSPEAQQYRDWLDQVLEGRRLILRVDRMELSKNVVRGLRAYEELLRMYPDWQGKVVHLALLYPSRRALYEYRRYEAEVFDLVDRINNELGTDDWQPIVVINEDNYVRALACLTSYDVLVVNPIVDGMNLVSKEGPAVNETDGVLILSRNAGSWEELGHGSLGVNPYDVLEIAEALNTALTMDPEERKARARVLREVVQRNDPNKWVWHQLHDIRRLHEA